MNPDYWPHAPEHRLSHAGTYFVTVGTYRKIHFFKDGARLATLQEGLLKYARKYGWRLEAWAVFPNHYHFVGHSPDGEDGAESLRALFKHFHSRSSAWINRLDGKPGRTVWHNFRDTRLTFEKSYLARLVYTHRNAVHHGLVPVANQYPWCRAAWFEGTAQPSMVRTIYGFKTDHLNVEDDY